VREHQPEIERAKGEERTGGKYQRVKMRIRRPSLGRAFGGNQTTQGLNQRGRSKGPKNLPWGLKRGGKRKPTIKGGRKAAPGGWGIRELWSSLKAFETGPG